MHRRRHHAFTLVELLLVVVIMSVIALVAYPALRSFQSRDKDASAATALSRLINRTADQARRRNRAYVVEITEQSEGDPQGLVTIRESTRPSCMLTRIDTTRILQTVPFGGTDVPEFKGDQEAEVGLAGWSRNGGEVVVLDDLTLCIGPSGALAVGVGPTAEPLSGRLDVKVQRFELEAGAWAPSGPARAVEMTYAGGARLGLNQ
jgi:prepilin-type N-terminal cleavage/methylation domain-containing protein